MKLQAAARMAGYLRANPQLVVSALIAMALLWSATSIVHTHASQPRASLAAQPLVVDLQSIRAAHLLGIAPENEAAGDTTAAPASLVLVGTLVNNDKAQALALIRADSQSAARIFRVGDWLPGGAVLLEVRPHSIVVEHNGITVALAFPRRFGAALAALLPNNNVEEIPEAEAEEAPHIYTSGRGLPKTEDYYAEQQVALLKEAGGS